MKNSILSLFIILILQSCVSNQRQEESQKVASNKPNQLTLEEIQYGWKLLFDGKTTDSWKNFKQQYVNEGWIVENGNLVALGKGGDLGGDIITEEQFEDFELYLEWAISEGGNSGIFYNVLEENYPTVYATGPEYQLIDDEGYPDPLEEWQKTGANYAMHNAAEKQLKPVGEFNSSKIKVKDGSVEHWLNGAKILEYELWSDDWKERVQNCKWERFSGLWPG